MIHEHLLHYKINHRLCQGVRVKTVQVYINKELRPFSLSTLKLCTISSIWTGKASACL